MQAGVRKEWRKQDGHKMVTKTFSVFFNLSVKLWSEYCVCMLIFELVSAYKVFAAASFVCKLSIKFCLYLLFNFMYFIPELIIYMYVNILHFNFKVSHSSNLFLKRKYHKNKIFLTVNAFKRLRQWIHDIKSSPPATIKHKTPVTLQEEN